MRTQLPYGYLEIYCGMLFKPGRFWLSDAVGFINNKVISLLRTTSEGDFYKADHQHLLREPISYCDFKLTQSELQHYMKCFLSKYVTLVYFRIKIIHIPGYGNAIADKLSLVSTTVNRRFCFSDLIF